MYVCKETHKIFLSSVIIAHSRIFCSFNKYLLTELADVHMSDYFPWFIDVYSELKNKPYNSNNDKKKTTYTCMSHSYFKNNFIWEFPLYSLKCNFPQSTENPMLFFVPLDGAAFLVFLSKSQWLCI